MCALDNEFLNCEVRFERDDSRQSPGRLTGTLLTYLQRAHDRPEMFTRGSLEWPAEGIVITRQHDRNQPIMRTVPYLEGDEVRISAELPDTTAGRDAAADVRSGLLTGLSVEFRSMKEGRRGGMREIRQAYVPRAGLVDSPSYTGSVVQVRERAEAGRRRTWL